jgi:hypothetical protein
LRLQPGVTVAGQVAFDGGAVPPNAGGLIVRLVETSEPIYTVPETRTQTDGSFVIRDVAAASYRFRIDPPTGWILAGIDGAGTDFADAPLVVTAGSEPVRVTVRFSKEDTELAGTLRDATDRPVTLFTIVVFAADRSFWTPLSRRIRVVRPADDGRFTMRGLPPGEYRIAAVTDVEDGRWFDPAFLRGLESSSVPVRMMAGQRTTQDMRIGR